MQVRLFFQGTAQCGPICTRTPSQSTTPAAAGSNNPDCVKWRETLPSQEKSAGRDIPMGQLVTKVLVSRESPLPPCQLWPGHDSPVPRRLEPGPDRCPHPRVDCGWIFSSSDQTRLDIQFLRSERARGGCERRKRVVI